MKALKVICVDDHDILREGLVAILKELGIHTIGQAANGLQLLNLLKSGPLPHVILLDIAMPEMDGNEVLPILKKEYPQIKVIVLTSFNHESLKEDFQRKGASAFLIKDTSAEIIASTIRRVYKSDTYHNFPEAREPFFTKIQMRIIPFLCAGFSSKQIATVLRLTEGAVEAHRTRLFKKTGAKNMAEFVDYSTTHGLKFLGTGTKQRPG